VAVQAFLDGRITFFRIADAIEEVLETLPDFGKIHSVETITAVDTWARLEAGKRVRGDAR
jgi:1-deoxy-D-xylulose 5-phosphate reductoisomerase